MADDLAALVDGRPGWHTDGDIARYVPGGTWSAQVREVANPRGRGGPVWHVALMDGAIARYTHIALSPAEAVRLAERLPKT